MKLVSLLKTVENSLVELCFNPNSQNDYETQHICELQFGPSNKLEEIYPENFNSDYFLFLLSCDVVSIFNGSNSLLVFLEDSSHG